jgi:S-DNA-T family DNA segregation ATPase FtsK/SpoIIIE
MQSRFSLATDDETQDYVIVEAAETTPIEEVGRALGEAVGRAVTLPHGSSVREWRGLSLLDGSVVEDAGTITDPHESRVQLDPEAPLGLFLAQVSGFGAGTIVHVAPGAFTIGSDERCSFMVDEVGVPRVAALITVEDSGRCRVEKTTADPAVSIEGMPVDGQVTWEPGHSLRVGARVYEVHTDVPLRASLTTGEQSHLLDFNRPPRLLPLRRQTSFTFPAEPAPNSRGSLPLIAIAAPLVVAVLMAVIMQRPYFLIFGLLSPVMMLANHASSRKSGKETFQEQKTKYRKVVAQVEGDLQQAVVDFSNERRMLSPDPATVGMIATTPTPRLWERRTDDPDHLSLRVGVANVESDVSAFHPEEVDHRRTQNAQAKDVPVTVSLAAVGVLGLCGDDSVVQRQAAWMVAQLAVTQSPRDLQLCVLTGIEREREWGWTRWLPHMRRGNGPVAAIGNDARTLGERVAELIRIIEQRADSGGRRDAAPVPAIVVVVDEVRQLRQWPGVARILSEGPAAGVYAICLDQEERFLPEEAHAIVSEADGQWTLRLDRENAQQEITPDLPEREWFEWISRALAPIRDATDESDSFIPSSVRFLESVALTDPTAEEIQGRWASAPRSTSAVVGESFDGIFSVDIRRDGPHLLIAGTTGSGKSELLQTLIASLALRNRPDEMTFVLIDYKGNAAFKDFVDLPHTVGLVTDLDGHLVQRAMDSLAAELRRREHLIATVGAKDIEEFTLARERGETRDLLPRLVLVIDEFAALKAELPEFVSGIVNIAQRGRSLGIHLIMATQRPQGTITGDILANITMRIALRMADPVESKDVVGTADAADISVSTPGRAFVKSGSSALVPFQSGRIGGPRPDQDSVTTEKPTACTVPWTLIGHPLSVPPTQDRAGESRATDLQVLVAALRTAASEVGIERLPSPWLPAMGSQVLLENIDRERRSRDAESADLPLIPFGLQDFPAEQSQRAAAIDLDVFSHMFVVGSPGSGRTQMLRTLAGSLALNIDVRDVHLYGIDFGNGGLRSLLELPQCATVISRTQTDLLGRFVRHLERETAERRRRLAEAGFSSVTEQRISVERELRIPRIVVLFDQWEGFINGIGDNGQSPIALSLLGLLREAASVGIHMVITGDRSLLSSRTNSLVEQKLMLRLADRSDYTMGGLSSRELPTDIGPGRAFESGTARETQIALLSAVPSSRAQSDALKVIGDDARSRMTTPIDTLPEFQRPIHFEELPAKVTWTMLSEPSESATSSWSLTLGMGGDSVEPIRVDLDRIPTFLVGGPSRSGRSTALMALTRSALEHGIHTVILAPLRSPLEQLKDHPHVVGFYGGGDISAQAVRDSLEQEDLLLVIDDASAISDFSVMEELKTISRAVNSNGVRVLAADGLDELERVGSMSWMNDIVKRRHGALFSPSSVFSGKPFGLALTQETLKEYRPTGRALVSLGDGLVTVTQIAIDE